MELSDREEERTRRHRKSINVDFFLQDYERLLDKDGIVTQEEENSLRRFISSVNKRIDELTLQQWAYLFATTFHETAHTFNPVVEAFWLSDQWRRNNLRYYPYHGRGYVQITWKENYEKYNYLTEGDMIKNPDLALSHDVAFEILLHGSKHGMFTGKKLSDYINNDKSDYESARRVINGTDKAELIGSYAKSFEQIIENSLT